jgi:hypothetical protein
VAGKDSGKREESHRVWAHSEGGLERRDPEVLTLGRNGVSETLGVSLGAGLPDGMLCSDGCVLYLPGPIQ